MKREKIREKTCLVIEKDGQYLTGIGAILRTPGWTSHLSDAWKTRDKEDALRKAEEYGGTLVLFNPIIWRTKRL